MSLWDCSSWFMLFVFMVLSIGLVSLSIYLSLHAMVYTETVFPGSASMRPANVADQLYKSRTYFVLLLLLYVCVCTHVCVCMLTFRSHFVHSAGWISSILGWRSTPSLCTDQSRRLWRQFVIESVLVMVWYMIIVPQEQLCTNNFFNFYYLLVLCH